MGAFFLAASTLLAGCGLGATAGSSAVQPGMFSGKVFGGRQPISGATLTLYKAGNGSVTAPYIAANTQGTCTPGYGACASVMGTATSGAGGEFTISRANLDTCTDPDQMYLVSSGGDTGGGSANAAAVLVAALGACSGVTGSTHVLITELTTVAAAYGLSGFVNFDGSSVNIGTTSTNTVGLQHAFANARMLVNTDNSQPNTTTPGGNGTIPVAILTTVANALVPCVNGTGIGSSGCVSLLVAAPVGSAAAPVTPSNTWQAALETALYPANNTTNICVNAVAAPTVYTPNLSVCSASAPNDFSLAIPYTLGKQADGTTAATAPLDVAADASGNIWISGMTGAPLVATDYSGTLLSGSGGYGDATFKALTSVGKLAVDTNTGTANFVNSVWVASTAGNVYQYAAAGGSLVNTYPTTGSITTPAVTVQNTPYSLAIDASNNVFFGTATATSSATNAFGELLKGGSTYAQRLVWSVTPATGVSNSGLQYLGVTKAATPVLYSTATTGTSSKPVIFTPSSATAPVAATASAYTAASSVVFDSSTTSAYIVGTSATGNGLNGRVNKYTTAAATPPYTTIPPTNTNTTSPKPTIGLTVGVMDGAAHEFVTTFAINASGFPLGLATLNTTVGTSPGTFVANGALTSSTAQTIQPLVTSGGAGTLLFAGATFTFTGSLTTGSATIASPSSTAGLYVGQTITGAGIPAGTTIATIAPTLTMSANATSNGTGVTITAGAATVIRNMAVDNAGTLWIANNATAAPVPLIQILGVAAPTRVVAAGGGARP